MGMAWDSERTGKIFGGATHKMRQDVAVHLFAHHKTACLLTLSPLACHEAACSEPVKRRFMRWSGRRGSNPRQPAWEAGTLPLSYSRMCLCYHTHRKLSIPFFRILGERNCVTSSKRDLHHDDEGLFISNLSVLLSQLYLHAAHIASDSFHTQETN